MRVSLLTSVASVLLLSSAAFAQNEGEFPATLKGHAVLPAESFIEAPADAPADLNNSGKYTTGKRVDALASVMGKSYERPTGVSLEPEACSATNSSPGRRSPSPRRWWPTCCAAARERPSSLVRRRSSAPNQPYRRRRCAPGRWRGSAIAGLPWSLLQGELRGVFANRHRPGQMFSSLVRACQCHACPGRRG